MSNVPGLFGVGGLYAGKAASSSSLVLPAVPRIMCLGDSNTAGSNGAYTGQAGGWPVRMTQYLRSLRSDFELVASQVVLPESSPGSSVPYNEGHAGFTIAQIAAGYTLWYGLAGGVDIALGDMAGTNDIATGRTLAQMQADTVTLYNNVVAQNPATIIVLMAPPPFVDGTTTHANLATWQAQQQAFTTWLQTVFCPSHPGNVIYCNASQLVGPGDFQSDGVHFNQQGSAVVGVGVAQQLNTLLGTRLVQPDVIPRNFTSRQPWGSYQCVTTGTDALTCTGHPGFNPGAGAFSIAFDFYPTSVAAGNATLINYGSYGTNNFFAVLRNANACRVYFMATTGPIASGNGATFSENPGLVVNTWHRIVVMADPVSQTVALYINGQLAGLATGVPAWTSTQQVFTIGKEAVFGAGAVGYYSRVAAWNAVPAKPGSLAALVAVERDYYLGQSIVPAKGTAAFSLDGVLTDDVYAPGDPNPSFVVVGGMTSVGGYPGGTPLRPWEYGGRNNFGPGI